jgi:hypothetical protein
VTSLADSGPGTLRDAVADGRSNLCVVMKVPGTIALESNLYDSGSNLTFDGSQAAVQVTGRPVVSSGDNIIHRYMRYRHGGPVLGDSTGVTNGEGIVYDHCSIELGADQSMHLAAVTGGQRIRRVTIQNSIVGATLGCPDPGSGRCNEHGTRYRHSVAALFGGDASDVTFYRNLTGWGESRHPQYGAGQRAKTCARPAGSPTLTRCTSRSCGYTNVRPTAADVAAGGRPDREIEWKPSVTDADDAPLLRVCHVLRQTPNSTAAVAADCSSGSFTARAAGVYVVPYEVDDGRDRASASLVVTVTRR